MFDRFGLHESVRWRRVLNPGDRVSLKKYGAIGTVIRVGDNGYAIIKWDGLKGEYLVSLDTVERI